MRPPERQRQKTALGPGVGSDLRETFETTIDWAYSSVKFLENKCRVNNHFLQWNEISPDVDVASAMLDELVD
jgi:hypothetical protein